MIVSVNGDATEVDSGTTVAQVVASLNRQGSGIAVAVNEEVLPRSRWGQSVLCEGDRLEVLTAAQGGC